jgi:hypothetical protein
MNQPAVFISCVSPEFRQTRSRVAAILTRLGYTPVIQEIFGTEPGDLRQVLRDKIDAWEGLIQMVGQGYGAEPPTVDAEYVRYPTLSSSSFTPGRRRPPPTAFARRAKAWSPRRLCVRAHLRPVQGEDGPCGWFRRPGALGRRGGARSIAGLLTPLARADARGPTKWGEASAQPTAENGPYQKLVGGGSSITPVCPLRASCAPVAVGEGLWPLGPAPGFGMALFPATGPSKGLLSGHGQRVGCSKT